MYEYQSVSKLTLYRKVRISEGFEINSVLECTNIRAFEINSVSECTNIRGFRN
jgi:hypothetical protein